MMDLTPTQTAPVDSLKLLSAAAVDGGEDGGEDAETEAEVDETAKDDLLIMTAAAVEVAEVAVVADAAECALQPVSDEDLGWPLSSPTATGTHSGRKQRRRR